MALRTSETDERNETDDRSQAHYDEKFNEITRGLSQRENSAISNDAISGYNRKGDGLDDHPITAGDASGKSGDIGKNIDDAKNAETNPNAINFTGGNSKVSGKVSTKRKKGPIALLITLFFGGAVAIGGIFGGPGLLIVNLAEVMTNKFNTQLSSMDTRTTKVINSKIASTTSGVCSSGISIMCKYSSLSDKQLAKITAPGTGIEVKDKGTTLITGRTKPTEYIFTDSKGATHNISAKEFPKFYATNTEFRASMKVAYNPKYAGFGDFISRKVFGWLKTSKKAPFAESDNTDEEKAKVVQDTTRSGTTDATIKRPTQASDGTWTDADGKPITAAQASELNVAANAATNAANTIADDVAAVEKTGLKAGSALEKGANLVSITGLASDACTTYGMINAVANGAKIIRAAQMARYAMIFLTTASMIKAGTAQASDVSYLGNTLTKTTKDNSKSATDSYGYQYAAGTVSGSIDAPASEYLAGGGLGGQFSTVTATVLGLLGGSTKSAKSTCQVVNNAAVQITGLIAGVALMIIPGGQAISGAKIAGQVALGIALFAATMILPQMLANMVAGTLVDSSTSGESAGNVIASGSSGMMSDMAGGGGNAPLTPDQAVAYQGAQNATLARYATEDRLTANQLDPTNANTFMGMMVTKLMPYTSNLSTVSDVLSASSSLIGSSFGALVSQPTKAASASDYTQCQDSDYRDLNLATDPFCNPIRGIPPQYLNDDPNTINQRLLAKGLIDQTTGDPISSYATFVTNCIDRTRPLGDTGTNGDEDPGDGCFIKDQDTADLYVHYIDQRVLTGMEEGYEGGDTAASTPGTNQPANSGNVVTDGWSFPTTAGAPVVRGAGPLSNGTYHTGIDFGVPSGSPFYASRDGTVELHQYDIRTINGDNGAWCSAAMMTSIVPPPVADPIQKDIWIKSTVSGQLYTSVYAHLSTYLVSDGQQVKAGDLIGYTGSSGCSTGPHVHFEIWKGVATPDKYTPNMIDPATVLGKSGG